MSNSYAHSDSQLEISPPSAVELLWLNHRGALLGGVAAIVAIALVVLGVFASMRATVKASENLLASATGDEGWNQVIEKYPHTSAAANAMLLLAASLRDQGKFEESNALYSRFAESFPTSTLAVSGLLGRASNARVSNHVDQALGYYQEAAAESSQSYGAPFALYSQARLLARLGRMDEARRVVQSLATQYPGSSAAQALGGGGQQAAGAQQN
jgi:TolA-binding protein